MRNEAMPSVAGPRPDGLIGWGMGLDLTGAALVNVDFASVVQEG
jgi:hypothetical protein